MKNKIKAAFIAGYMLREDTKRPTLSPSARADEYIQATEEKPDGAHMSDDMKERTFRYLQFVAHVPRDMDYGKEIKRGMEFFGITESWLLSVVDAYVQENRGDEKAQIPALAIQALFTLSEMR